MLPTHPQQYPTGFDLQMARSAPRLPTRGRQRLIATLIGATLTAVAAFTLILSSAAADAPNQPDTSGGQQQVYLSMVAINARQTARASAIVPDATITVAAQVSQSCKPGTSAPVSGARITVITSNFSTTTTTNATGHATFGATGVPARVQIEWPAGLFPCPNSQPTVELPDGSGAVDFVAQAYP
jgi:hypothetical protein